MSNINILFFSNQCTQSQVLITMMRQEGLDRFFYTICVDYNPNVPKYITGTPTVLIKGVPMPYVKADAFKWLARIKQWKMQMMIHNASVQQQKIYQGMNNNVSGINSNMLEFSPEEMAGMSDIFSYLATGKLDDSTPKSFLTCDQVGKTDIFLAPEENNPLNEKEQSKILNKLKLERESQVKRFEQCNEQFINSYKKN